jgi:hypothetical protein
MPIAIGLPLDLPDVRVLATQVLQDATLLIEVESTLGTAQCHCCGREIDRFHGSDRPALIIIPAAGYAATGMR